MADRQLRVTLVGDTRNLDRALGRTETRLKKFGRVAGSASSAGGLGGIGGVLSGRGLAAGSAATLAVAGLKSFVDASREAEVILGQTSIAVENAGLSWRENAAIIDQAATRISKSSSFDDEAVLQSFQVFVRSQKNVAKAIDLAGLAADVARGRYTDLASGTQLVNKAALGQVGALRRAGIAIDANATSVEALAKLQEAFGGSSKKFSESAAGSSDRLRVAWENLGEDAGGPLSKGIERATNKLTDFVVFSDEQAIPAAKILGGAFEDLGVTGGRLGGILDFAFKTPLNPLFTLTNSVKILNGLFGETKDTVTAAAKAFDESFGLGALQSAGTKETAPARKPGATPAFGEPGFKATDRGSQLTREQSLLIQAEKAKLNSFLSDDLKVAKALVKVYRSLIPGKKGEELVQAQQDLLGAQLAVFNLNEQIAADAKAVQDKATEADNARKAAHKKAIAALKSQAQAFKDQADSIKSAVLDAFDSKTTKIDNARALDDAKKALAQAKQLGGTETIKLAGRDLVDAQRAVQRQRLEQTAFKVTQGPAGPVNTLQVGSVTINVNGAGDPEQVANKVLAALQRRSKQNASQTRGRSIGHHVLVVALLGVSVAPSDNWNEADPAWERLDVTYNVQEWEIDRGRVFEFDRTDTGRATVSLVDKFGDFDPTNTSAPYWDLTVRQAGIALQNPVDSAWSTLFRGFVQRVEWVPYQNEQWANVRLYLVDALALAAKAEMAPDGTFGDSVDNGNITFQEDLTLDAVKNRMDFVLTQWGWPDLRSIYTGNVKLQGTVYAPRSPVLTVIQDAADGDHPVVGNVFISREGLFVFRGRQSRFDWSNPTYDIDYWQLGDDTAALADPTNVVRISPPLLASRDDDNLYTSAIATPQNIADADIAGQYGIDGTGLALYGTRTWSAENLTTAGGASSATALQETTKFADHILGNYPTPRTRCGAITIRPQNPNGVHGEATWAFMCGVDVSDVTHLTTTHVGGGGFDEDFFIEGVHYTAKPMNATQHEVTLTLDVSPASYYDSDPFS